MLALCASDMKAVLLKLIQGVGFGVGAALVIVIAISLYDSYRQKIKSWFGPNCLQLKEVEDPGLEIVFHKRREA